MRQHHTYHIEKGIRVWFHLMNNALAIFESLKTYSDIQSLIGRQEDIFIDFKERDSTRWKSAEKLSEDEERLFNKAASGFAHQEGGVLIWGIEARKNADGIDQANALKPFQKVKQFKQALEGQTKHATEPIVDGVLHSAFFVNGDQDKNEGVVASYFPKSSRVHRALGKTTNDFYKRHGDSFTPLSTEEIKLLFYRTLAPDLIVVCENSRTLVQGDVYRYQFRVGVKNEGAGIAKFISLHLSLLTDIPLREARWYDGQGGYNYPVSTTVDAPHLGQYGQQVIVRGDMVLYPGQNIMVCTVSTMAPHQDAPWLKYQLFAEHMVPKEGDIGPLPFP